MTFFRILIFCVLYKIVENIQIDVHSIEKNPFDNYHAKCSACITETSFSDKAFDFRVTCLFLSKKKNI